MDVALFARPQLLAIQQDHARQALAGPQMEADPRPIEERPRRIRQEGQRRIEDLRGPERRGQAQDVPPLDLGYLQPG